MAVCSIDLCYADEHVLFISSYKLFMTLQQVNQRLLEINVELKNKVPELVKAEWLYDQKFTQVVLASGASNQASREGEAKLAADVGGFYQPYITLKQEVRLLYTEKDILTEYSRNLRSIAIGDSKEY